MDDNITLSTGRTISANCGIVGIDPYGEVFGGFDDGIRGASQFDRDADKFTAEERSELADLIIARWVAFKTDGAE